MPYNPIITERGTDHDQTGLLAEHHRREALIRNNLYSITGKQYYSQKTFHVKLPACLIEQ